MRIVVHLYRIFDVNGDNEMTVDELSKMVSVLQNNPTFGGISKAGPSLSIKLGKNANVIEESPMRFLAPSGKDNFSLQEFISFMNDYKTAISSLEFQRFQSSAPEEEEEGGEEEKDKGVLSASDFAYSLVSYAPPNEIHKYAARAARLDSHPGTVTWYEWQQLNKAMDEIEEIIECLETFLSVRANSDYSRSDLKRAVMAVTGIELTDIQIEVIFTVFDSDGNDELSRRELEVVMLKRQTRNLRKNRALGFSSFLSCVGRCLSRDQQ